MTDQFLSSRRDGDATYRCALAAAATTLLLLAPVADAHRTGATAPPQSQQQDQRLEQQEDVQQQNVAQQSETQSEELSRKALASHEESDTGPVENWFGCPPEGDPEATGTSDSQLSAARSETTEYGENECDSDAAVNESPQKTNTND